MHVNMHSSVLIHQRRHIHKSNPDTLSFSIEMTVSLLFLVLQLLSMEICQRTNILLLTSQVTYLVRSVPFSFAVAKVRQISETTKTFKHFFSKKCVFGHKKPVFRGKGGRTPFIYTRARGIRSRIGSHRMRGQKINLSPRRWETMVGLWRSDIVR